MTNLEKYNDIFMKTFAISEERLNEELTVFTLENWDSLAQMNLITALEGTFDIMLEPDEIIELSSYEIGKEILTRYNISF